MEVLNLAKGAGKRSNSISLKAGDKTLFQLQDSRPGPVACPLSRSAWRAYFELRFCAKLQVFKWGGLHVLLNGVGQNSVVQQLVQGGVVVDVLLGSNGYVELSEDVEEFLVGQGQDPFHAGGVAQGRTQQGASCEGAKHQTKRRSLLERWQLDNTPVSYLSRG